MLVLSFDIKFIRQDQKQRRNGEACRAVIENTMLLSFDIKFIKHGKACRASPT